MESSFIHGTNNLPAQPGMRNDEAARILEMQPYRTDEAFLNPVVDCEDREYERTKHGVTDRQIMTLEQGNRLEVVQGTPAHQRSEIPVVMTTALGTSIYGHNWHTMLSLMDLGYPVVMVGPNGGNAKLPKSPKQALQIAKNMASISLEGIAVNIHNILDETDRRDKYKVGDIMYTGESQGHMALLAGAALAGYFGRTVAYADGIAGCFPTRRRDLKEHLSLLPETLKQTSILGKISLGMSARHAAEMPRTINPNPYFLAHVVASIPALVSGSAGDFARQLDSNVKLKKTLFVGDTWCNTRGWMHIFNPEDFPYVDIDLVPGNHMTIVTKGVQDAREARFRALRDEMETTHGDQSAVDWKHVMQAGQSALRGKLSLVNSSL
jgi:hypothetical protein